MWEVLEYIDGRYDLCRCDCGQIKHVRRDHRKAALSTQCSRCNSYHKGKDTDVKPELPTKAVYTKEEREIRHIVKEAKRRCIHPEHKWYKNYGGRGITFSFKDVSQAVIWIIANLGPKPKGLTLDRIDNNRGYEPKNLRWATYAEQNRNKRKSVCKARVDEIRPSV